ncbi:hypothetical protein GP486_007466 [Trichoglossum hirsutum]|uniref:Uncharacterized protein n=1 Tax=Trichoglossum hirsutum TaxID=265104 RepID=A0A9P8IJG0_9PEZI|nr:hypothetical protein GP486_007466 [Trichoglossum hirsutum]
MTSKQLQWMGVPRSRLPKIPTSTTTRQGGAAPKAVFPPYIDHQLTRERQKAQVRCDNTPAKDALIEDISKRKPEPIPEEPNPAFEVLNRKKRFLSRLLSFGLSGFLTTPGRCTRPAPPKSIHPISLQGQQDESKRFLGHRREHSCDSREGIRMQRISREPDMLQLGGSPPALLGASDNQTQASWKEPLSTQATTDHTNHSWAGIAFREAIDSDVPDSGEVPCDPALALSRDTREYPTVIRRKSKTRGFLPRLHTILEVSYVPTPRQSISAGRDNGGPPPSDTDQPWSGDVMSLDLSLPCNMNMPIQKQNIAVCGRPSGSSHSHLDTPLDKATGRNEPHYSRPCERCFQRDGSRESKRIRTFNWIQRLSQSDGVTLNTLGPGKVWPASQNHVPHQLPSSQWAADTRLAGAEACPSESPSTPTAELKPVKECLPIEESQDPAGSISSQRRGGCDPAIGASCIDSKKEFSAGGLSSTNMSATIRRSATSWNLSGPASRVVLSPETPIGARRRVSRRGAIWGQSSGCERNE